MVRLCAHYTKSSFNFRALVRCVLKIQKRRPVGLFLYFYLKGGESNNEGAPMNRMVHEVLTCASSEIPLQRVFLYDPKEYSELL